VRLSALPGPLKLSAMKPTGASAVAPPILAPMTEANEDELRFSAKFEERLGSAGPPTDAPLAGVRDVIVCVKGSEQVDPDDFRENPPVGAAQWMRHHRDPDNRVGPVNLGRGIRLEHIDRADAQLVQFACQPRGHYFFPVGAPNQVYSFVRSMPPSEHDAHPYRWDPDGVLNDALSLCRLIRDNGFSKQYAARINDYADGEQQVVYLPWAEDAIIWRLHRHREYLAGPEAEELAQLLAAYWEIGEALPGRVSRAFWRADYAPRFRWADLVLSFVVSALEALLTVEQTKFTRNFKRRAAALANELGVEEVDQAFCERMYRARSEWVHGSRVSLFAPPAPGEMETPGPAGPESKSDLSKLSEVALLQDLLRKALRRCIEDSKLRAVFSNDEAIQERWPV
jgi:hypothetical protein